MTAGAWVAAALLLCSGCSTAVSARPALTATAAVVSSTAVATAKAPPTATARPTMTGLPSVLPTQPGPLPWIIEARWTERYGQTAALVTGRTGLFRLSDSDGFPDTGVQTVSRIDPVSGATLVTRSLRGATDLVASAGNLWVSVSPPSQSVGGSRLVELSQAALVVERVVPIDSAPGFLPTYLPDGARSLAVAGGRIWFAFENQLRAVDATSGREVVRIVEPDGALAGGVASTPDGRQVWTSGYAGGARDVPVELRDARNGAVVASTRYGSGGDVSPTPWGAWMSDVGGNLANLTRLRVVGGRIQAQAVGVYGNSLDAGVVDGVLWLSTDRGLSCADPSTGRVRVAAYGDVASDAPIPVWLGAHRLVMALPGLGAVQTLLVVRASPRCLA